jgi:hypothetical protein
MGTVKVEWCNSTTLAYAFTVEGVGFNAGALLKLIHFKKYLLD